ncbi:MAG: metal (Ni/Fe) hydrogenase large subunit, partial [Leptospira sp.]|nr:metal (Ni/Fe) hydrogenase large subunit [Leptospira sp.]
DYRYPIWMLRHSLGVPGGDEDYTGSYAIDHSKDERTEELEVSALENGALRDLVFRGLKVHVSPRGYSHAVGPIHAGVIEPGHFRFSVEGEVIQSLHIRLGFQKRNIPEILKGKTPIGAMPYSEAISGDTAVGYATAFAGCYEQAMSLNVPEELKFVRAILLEVERVAIHIGDLGAMAGDIGYYPLLGLCSTDRGVPLGVMEALTGSRFGKGAIWPGEVRLNRKLNINTLKDLPKRLKDAFTRVETQFLRATKSSTIRERLQGCGVVDQFHVQRNGFVGMAARSTGVRQDMRHAEEAYKRTSTPMQLELDRENLKGDAWARFYLRYLECKNSVEWLMRAIPEIDLSAIHKGPLLIQKQKKTKPGIYFSSVEGWRGSVLVALDLDSAGKIIQSYIRDPSVLNWHALELAVQGELIGDFPLNNKSFNLSYVGFDL